ncbi:DMT family transporter [Rhizobium sp. FKL33]|uniref:DMT family transporter n=1 Tax=Rhizobium sp. FKL33 TaxID=2562307 RepID=UPI0010C071B7|nr:DMT family transporter [Rhizobium sp. FKL33]
MATAPVAQEGTGALLVFLSAVAWSFGGALARYLDIADSWTVVFWRGLFAGLFLLGFLLLRDGPLKTLSLYRNMGVPGLLVAFGFAVASSCFVIAISYTTVANVVLIQAGVPLFAALIAWILFRERVTFATWLAIVAVIAGVAIMVAGGPLLAVLAGDEAQGAGAGAGADYPMAWFGNLLALAIAIVFAMTTVVTRRFPNVRQTPGASLGCFAACAFAATQASGFAVTPGEFGVLFVFGALNLGLGMALFVTGARLIPSAFAALLGTAETMLGPVWVAIFHGEVPGPETVVGGLIILAALIFYLSKALKRQAPAPAIAAKP